MPGETANLLVQFDSKNKGEKGGQFQSKRITITANTEPVHTYLVIRGKVDKKEETTAARNGDFDLAASDLNVYPNPTQDHVELQIENHDGVAVNVDMYNAQGLLVMNEKIDAISTQPLRLPLTDIEDGIYSLVVKIEGKNLIAKQIMVKK